MLILSGAYSEEFDLVTIHVSDGNDFAVSFAYKSMDAAALCGLLETLLEDTKLANGKTLIQHIEEQVAAAEGDGLTMETTNPNPNKEEVGS